MIAVSCIGNTGTGLAKTLGRTAHRAVFVVSGTERAQHAKDRVFKQPHEGEDTPAAGDDVASARRRFWISGEIVDHRQARLACAQRVEIKSPDNENTQQRRIAPALGLDELFLKKSQTDRPPGA